MTWTLTNWQLEIHRRNTQRFIDADPTAIDLISEVAVWDSGTKTLQNGSSRGEQNFKVIWPQGVPIATNAEGQSPKFNFILVGSYDAEIAIGDHWSQDGQDYRIDYLYPFNEYEVKAGGTLVGSFSNVEV